MFAAGRLRATFVALALVLLMVMVSLLYGCGAFAPEAEDEEIVTEPTEDEKPQEIEEPDTEEEPGKPDPHEEPREPAEPEVQAPVESGADPSADPPSTEPSPDEELVVHFIDVGQGDAVLIEAESMNILIDAGTRGAGEVVVEYLVRRGIRELDLVIGTHPHADHIGGLIEVFRSFKVSRIIDAGVPHTTVTFDDYLTEIEKQVEAGHCTYEVPGGQVITDGAMVLTVLGPDRDLGSLNNNSVVCRVDFGSTSFLFMGDAERAAEESLLRRGVQLGACVLKVGHHGSRTSTTADFLDAVSPKYAVIMCGKDNRYGHPHEEVLARLTSADVEIYRTDVHGTVVFTSDATTLAPSESP